MSGWVLGLQLCQQLRGHVRIKIYADFPARIERDGHAATNFAQQPGKLSQAATRKLRVLLDERFGTFGAGEHDWNAIAIFIFNDQGLGLRRTLESRNGVLFVANRHEALLIEQTKHEGFGLERTGMDSGKLFFKCVVWDEIHDVEPGYVVSSVTEAACGMRNATNMLILLQIIPVAWG